MFTFSSDGKRFAFWIKVEQRYAVVIDGLESNPRTATFDDFVLTPYLFSRDGKRTAYWVKTGGEWFFVVDGKPGSGYESGGDNVGIRTPFFSPDGERVTFCAKSSGEWYLGLDNDRYGPYDSIAEGTPQFSADGRRLVWAALNGQEWIVVADGTVLGRCDGVRRETPQFSADGTRVVWGGSRRQMVHICRWDERWSLRECLRGYSYQRATTCRVGVPRDHHAWSNFSERRDPNVDVDGVATEFVTNATAEIVREFYGGEMVAFKAVVSSRNEEGRIGIGWRDFSNSEGTLRGTIPITTLVSISRDRRETVSCRLHALAALWWLVSSRIYAMPETLHMLAYESDDKALGCGIRHMVADLDGLTDEQKGQLQIALGEPIRSVKNATATAARCGSMDFGTCENVNHIRFE